MAWRAAAGIGCGVHVMRRRRLEGCTATGGGASHAMAEVVQGAAGNWHAIVVLVMV